MLYTDICMFVGMKVYIHEIKIFMQKSPFFIIIGGVCGSFCGLSVTTCRHINSEVIAFYWASVYSTYISRICAYVCVYSFKYPHVVCDICTYMHR